MLVVQPSLRLCYRRDGSLNLKGLLANPWPGPFLDKTPPIVIQDGTLELVPDDEGPSEVASPGKLSPVPEGGSPESPTTSGPLPSRPGGARGLIVLREVSIHIKQVGALLFVFEGTARGDSLDRLQLHGSIDLETGRTTLNGNLDALTLSDALQRRLPREVRPMMKAMAMTGGVVDLDLKRATYDPKAPPESRLTYALEARLHEGVWECPKLPFHVNNFTAVVGVEDGLIHIKHAEGFNGRTTLRARGTLRAGEPHRAPMDLHVELIDLDLDPRLRQKTPAAYDELWDVFQPRGRVDAEVDVARTEPGGAVELGAKVICRDVAANYRHFAYPVDHLTGELTLKKKILDGQPEDDQRRRPTAPIEGDDQQPGGRCRRRPRALGGVGPDRRAADQGVQARSAEGGRPSSRRGGRSRPMPRISRVPMAGRPEGLIAIHSEIDLSENCEIKWAKLPYPIRNLTGRLELHPDRWVFNNVRGRNGEATINASGWVNKLSDKRLRQWRLPPEGARRAPGPEPPVQRGATQWRSRMNGTRAGRRSTPRAPATSNRPR